MKQVCSHSDSSAAKLTEKVLMDLIDLCQGGKWKFSGSGDGDNINREVRFTLSYLSSEKSEKIQMHGSLYVLNEETISIKSYRCSYEKYKETEEDEESETEIKIEIISDDVEKELPLLTETIQSRILENKYFKYFMDSYHRLNSAVIQSRITELTETGLLKWTEILLEESPYSEIYRYTSEFGEETYEFTVEDIIDEDEYDKEFDGCQMHSELIVNEGSYLSLSYYDVDQELEDLIRNANRKHLISVQDLIVRSSDFSCIHNAHKLKKVNAIVNVMTGSGIKEVNIDAAYCAQCDRYYILETNYRMLKRQGRICCQVVEYDVLKKQEQGDGFSNWAAKSILSLYGYNVNAKDNLSERERERILSFLIENDIETPGWIASFLSLQIENKSGKLHMENAIAKWEHDIRFVQEYKKSDTTIRVNKIYVKNRR